MPEPNLDEIFGAGGETGGAQGLTGTELAQIARDNGGILGTPGQNADGSWTYNFQNGSSLTIKERIITGAKTPGMSPAQDYLQQGTVYDILGQKGDPIGTAYKAGREGPGTREIGGDLYERDPDTGAWYPAPVFGPPSTVTREETETFTTPIGTATTRKKVEAEPELVSMGKDLVEYDRLSGKAKVIYSATDTSAPEVFEAGGKVWQWSPQAKKWEMLTEYETPAEIAAKTQVSEGALDREVQERLGNARNLTEANRILEDFRHNQAVEQLQRDLAAAANQNEEDLLKLQFAENLLERDERARLVLSEQDWQTTENAADRNLQTVLAATTDTTERYRIATQIADNALARKQQKDLAEAEQTFVAGESQKERDLRLQLATATNEVDRERIQAQIDTAREDRQLQERISTAEQTFVAGESQKERDLRLQLATATNEVDRERIQAQIDTAREDRQLQERISTAQNNLTKLLADADLEWDRQKTDLMNAFNNKELDFEQVKQAATERYQNLQLQLENNIAQLQASVSIRGQDITQRGQDIEATLGREQLATTRRGQDIGAATDIARMGVEATTALLPNIAPRGSTENLYRAWQSLGSGKATSTQYAPIPTQAPPFDPTSLPGQLTLSALRGISPLANQMAGIPEGGFALPGQVNAANAPPQVATNPAASFSLPGIV